MILIVKAIICPSIGFISIYLIGFKFDLIPDKLLCFLLFTNFCTPTAINMITIAVMNKFQVK
jgi:hypothetical protein